jgi:hypothetical protein
VHGWSRDAADREVANGGPQELAEIHGITGVAPP